MKKIIIWLIRAYQITPFHTHNLCRFTPTCSEYMIGSLNKYGVLKGLFLGIKRILRCHPFGKFGYDPVK
jgi:putative membrane protein insertion efficiency factor